MDFTLFYRGSLTAAADATEQRALRRSLHAQLRELWRHAPLDTLGADVLQHKPSNGDLGILRDNQGVTYAPLVCEELGLLAELELRVLWSASPGSLPDTEAQLDSRVNAFLQALRYDSAVKASRPGRDLESGRSTILLPTGITEASC
jgi:hypothetical protein